MDILQDMGLKNLLFQIRKKYSREKMKIGAFSLTSKQEMANLESN